jgi:hypothetical protein
VDYAIVHSHHVKLSYQAPAERMSVSEQRAQIEQVWTKTFRQTRQATQVVERQLQQEEKQLLQELANLRDSPCPGAIISNVERTLEQKESDLQDKLRKLQIAYLQANIDLKTRGWDALLAKHDEFWQAQVEFFQEATDAWHQIGSRMKGALTGEKDNPPIGLPPLPKFDSTAAKAIVQVAGRDTEIDLVLHSMGNVLHHYEQRKRRRRILFHGVRVLLFLGLVFFADSLLGFVQPFELYLLAAVSAWFLDEYFTRPALEKKFKQWNVHELKQTITDFYRAQRSALYFSAALEKMLREAIAVLETAET